MSDNDPLRDNMIDYSVFDIENKELISVIKHYKLSKKINIDIKKIEKEDFLIIFLKKIVIPKISYAKQFINCSFVDIMGGTFCKKKCGFSGTVSIKLPECKDKYNTYYNPEYNFCSRNIVENKADTSAVYAAILDLTDKGNPDEVKKVSLTNEKGTLSIILLII